METKLFNFLKLYNLLIENFREEEKQIEIAICYLNETFNIEINDKKERVFKYELKMPKDKYDYLVIYLLKDFIENHAITLPFFTNLDHEDVKLYYNSSDSINKPFDYDKAKIHLIKNNFITLKTYYFNGLNDISYQIQDIALSKLNQKVYTKKINN